MKVKIEVTAGATDVYGNFADYKNTGSAELSVELIDFNGATFAGIIDALAKTAAEKHLAKLAKTIKETD